MIIGHNKSNKNVLQKLPYDSHKIVIISLQNLLHMLSVSHKIVAFKKSNLEQCKKCIFCVINAMVCTLLN